MHHGAEHEHDGEQPRCGMCWPVFSFFCSSRNTVIRYMAKRSLDSEVRLGRTWRYVPLLSPHSTNSRNMVSRLHLSSAMSGMLRGSQKSDIQM